MVIYSAMIVGVRIPSFPSVRPVFFAKAREPNLLYYLPIDVGRRDKFMPFSKQNADTYIQNLNLTHQVHILPPLHHVLPPIIFHNVTSL